MTVYVKARGRNFKKRDGRGGPMILITREPIAFEHLTAEELAADQWLEVLEEPPAPSVKKKRAKKQAKPKPKAEPKPEKSPADSLSFGKAKTADALPALKPDGLLE